jgi:hypothetical protein
MVQVEEGKNIRSGSRTPSFVVWIHKLKLASIMAECHVNLVVVCISSPKNEKPSKLLIGDIIPPSLGRLVEFSCVFPLLNIQGGKELCNYLVLPILSEGHDISQVLGLTCSDNLIKDPAMLSLHIVPIYPLGNHHWLVLRNYF